MAWKSFNGDRSPKVIAWQQRNREVMPNLAAMGEGFQTSAERKSVEALSKGFKDSFVNTGEFMGEEVARFNLGVQTKTEAAIHTVGDFVGEEFARFNLGETTKSEIFSRKIVDFLGEEAARIQLGEPTKTRANIIKGLDALSRMPAEEVSEHLGRVLGDVYLGFAAVRVAGLASEAVAQVANQSTNLAKKFIATHDFRSPLIFTDTGTQFNMGLPLNQIKVQNPIINKELEVAINQAQRGISEAPIAASISDALRLQAELAFKEVGFLDMDGQLTQKALENMESALGKNKKLGNEILVKELKKLDENLDNWSKYKTPMIKLNSSQQAEIHYYYNKTIDKIYTDIDFKIKNIIDPFVPQRDPKMPPFDLNSAR